MTSERLAFARFDVFSRADPTCHPMGGLFAAHRSEGAARLKQRLEQLAGRYGERFAPRPGWDALKQTD